MVVLRVKVARNREAVWLEAVIGAFGADALEVELEDLQEERFDLCDSENTPEHASTG